MDSVPQLVSSSHEVKIIDRREIYLTGVKKITSFDHEEFLLETTMGTLLLKGSNLELLKLDTHDGNVKIKGKIKERGVKAKERTLPSLSEPER